MKFNEFINKIKDMGGVDTDGYYGKQCMDLYNYFCNNVLGLQNVGADYAKNILNNPNIMNNVERINNYPEFVPQKGDIAVFTGGNYGHVAICLGEGDLKAFKTIDQNWVEQQLTEEWHNYTYLSPLVFLRPKNQENIVEPSVQTVTLPASVQSWRVYPLNKQPIVGNECGKLFPSKFGGLTYEILRWTQKNVAVIKTRDFGEVQIYVGVDTSAVIK
ncbi:MAG: CHAP domain-containing protein [Clostridia bacterium]